MWPHEHSQPGSSVPVGDKLARAAAAWFQPREAGPGVWAHLRPSRVPEGLRSGRGPQLGFTSRPTVLFSFTEGVERPFLNAVMGAAHRHLHRESAWLVASTSEWRHADDLRRWLPAPGCVARTPIDFITAVNRFFDRMRPSAVCIVGRSVRPAFVEECERRGIPVAMMATGALDLGLGAEPAFRDLFRPTFGRLSVLTAPDTPSLESFRAAGVPAGRCVHLGSPDSAHWPNAVDKLVHWLIDEGRPHENGERGSGFSQGRAH